MKIVYILEQFYLHGGIEKIVAEKVNWLNSNGYNVSIIATNQNNKAPIYKLNESIILIDLGINYKQGFKYLHPKNLSKVPKHFIKLKNTLKKLQPDVIITVSLQFDYYFLPYISSASIVKEFHASRYLDNQNRKKATFLRKIKNKIHDYLENKYTSNVVLNKDEKKHYKSNNVVVIPNGILINNTIQAELENKTVIAAGRLAPVKNFEELILIWKEISKKFPKWKLNIFGEGTEDYKNKLQTLIKKQSIENTCCLCGATNKLENHMIKSSIYLMTSHTECYPMVLLEAKNVGLPIISYNSPYGPSNIINNEKDGLIVEMYNKNEYINSIKKLIENKKLRITFGNNAKNNIHNNDIDKIMKQWIELFNKIANNK